MSALSGSWRKGNILWAFSKFLPLPEFWFPHLWEAARLPSSWKPTQGSGKSKAAKEVGPGLWGVELERAKSSLETSWSSYKDKKALKWPKSLGWLLSKCMWYKSAPRYGSEPHITFLSHHPQLVCLRHTFRLLCIDYMHPISLRGL